MYNKFIQAVAQSIPGDTAFTFIQIGNPKVCTIWIQAAKQQRCFTFHKKKILYISKVFLLYN